MPWRQRLSALLNLFLQSIRRDEAWIGRSQTRSPCLQPGEDCSAKAAPKRPQRAVNGRSMPRPALACSAFAAFAARAGSRFQLPCTFGFFRQGQGQAQQAALAGDEGERAAAGAQAEG